MLRLRRIAIEEERQNATHTRSNQQEKREGYENTRRGAGNSAGPGDTPEKKSDGKGEKCQTSVPWNVQFPSGGRPRDDHHDGETAEDQRHNHRKLRRDSRKTLWRNGRGGRPRKEHDGRNHRQIILLSLSACFYESAKTIPRVRRL
jgi:hypothetical protein